MEVPSASPDWIPLSIPLIIKQLVGDALTYVYISCVQEQLLTLIRLEQISLALDYTVGMV